MAQNEPLAITLTMEQWATVRHCLIEVADANKAQVYFWENCCKDPQLGAETAARYRGPAEEIDAIRKVIEAAIYPQPTPESE